MALPRPTTCVECGTAITNNHRGRPRLYCSDYCRKQHNYATPCESCGQPLYTGYKVETRICSGCIADGYAKRNHRICEAWIEGVPTAEIAQREGVTAAAVTSVVGRERHEGSDLPLRRRRNRELWPEIKRRWDAGETVSEIAAALDTTLENIYCMTEAMRDVGVDIPARSRGFLPKDEILTRFDSGEPAKSIAAALCLNCQSVRSLIQRNRGTTKARPAA